MPRSFPLCSRVTADMLADVDDDEPGPCHQREHPTGEPILRHHLALLSAHPPPSPLSNTLITKAGSYRAALGVRAPFAGGPLQQPRRDRGRPPHATCAPHTDSGTLGQRHQHQQPWRQPGRHTWPSKKAIAACAHQQCRERGCDADTRSQTRSQTRTHTYEQMIRTPTTSRPTL